MLYRTCCCQLSYDDRGCINTTCSLWHRTDHRLRIPPLLRLLSSVLASLLIQTDNMQQSGPKHDARSTKCNGKRRSAIRRSARAISEVFCFFIILFLFVYLFFTFTFWMFYDCCDAAFVVIYPFCFCFLISQFLMLLFFDFRFKNNKTFVIFFFSCACQNFLKCWNKHKMKIELNFCCSFFFLLFSYCVFLGSCF